MRPSLKRAFAAAFLLATAEVAVAKPAPPQSHRAKRRRRVKSPVDTTAHTTAHTTPSAPLNLSVRANPSAIWPHWQRLTYLPVHSPAVVRTYRTTPFHLRGLQPRVRAAAPPPPPPELRAHAGTLRMRWRVRRAHDKARTVFPARRVCGRRRRRDDDESHDDDWAVTQPDPFETERAQPPPKKLNNLAHTFVRAARNAGVAAFGKRVTYVPHVFMRAARNAGVAAFAAPAAGAVLWPPAWVPGRVWRQACGIVCRLCLCRVCRGEVR